MVGVRVREVGLHQCAQRVRGHALVRPPERVQQRERDERDEERHRRERRQVRARAHRLGCGVQEILRVAAFPDGGERRFQPRALAFARAPLALKRIVSIVVRRHHLEVLRVQGHAPPLARQQRIVVRREPR